jgi:WhiB family transcriptional regulator, redox-sensing transcriptional regulator
MTVRTNWREHAACRDADPDLFFPIGTAGNSLRQVDEAKRICHRCPAQNQCLAWALENGITDGVWGGTTENERRAIRSLDAATSAPLRLGTSNPAPLVAAGDAARTVAGQLAFLAQTRLTSAPDLRIGDGFARDFATADGERVMVAAITRQQFADLAVATRLARTFAFLERVLDADFSTCSDLHTHRDAIAALLAPWFSRCTVSDLVAAFAGTSVPWARLHNQTGQPGSRQARIPTQDHSG